MTITRPCIVVAACALVDRSQRVLIARRPDDKSLGGLWEFPGGKLEPGESPEQTVIRELREELAVGIRIMDLRPLSFASHAYADFHLLMPFFVCRRWDGEPQAIEHQQIAWVRVSELADAQSPYRMPPADAPLLSPLAAWIECDRVG